MTQGYSLTPEKTVALDLCFANTAEGLLSRQRLGNYTGALSDVIVCLSFLPSWVIDPMEDKVSTCDCVLILPRHRPNFQENHP